jgi:steroid delta-isomerase-like uncharacterized protein
MHTDTNKAVVHRYLTHVVGAKNLELLDEVIAPDFVAIGSNRFGTIRGRHALRATLERMFSIVPDYIGEIEDIISEGGKVVARVKCAGTHSGPFMGLQPTGRRLSWAATFVFRIEDGKIVEEWWQEDLSAIVEQITKGNG